jgi:DNA-binding response OmpR family regulator
MARILLVDDDPAMLDTARRALELDGHAVTTSDDGADAQCKLRAGGDFDVLVTDVQMPALDGVTLARGALADNPRLKVLLMSAHSDVLDKAKGLAPGVRVIAKPFAIDRIRAEVRSLAGG